MGKIDLIVTFSHIFKVRTLTRNAHSLALFQLEGVFLLELVIVRKWWGQSLSEGITCTLSKSTRGELFPSRITGILFAFLLILLPFLCVHTCWILSTFQIWKEAFKHSSTHFSMLPCERGRLCYHWPVQVKKVFYISFYIFNRFLVKCFHWLKIFSL